MNGNKLDSDHDFVYIYFLPKSKETMTKNWDNNRIKDVAEKLKEWTALKYIPEAFQNWGTLGGGRYTEGLPGLTFEQRCVAGMAVIDAFIVDSPIRLLESNRDWWYKVGRHFIRDLRTIYDGNSSGLTLSIPTYDHHRGKLGIPDTLITSMNQAIQANVELEQKMTKFLQPKVYDLSCKGMIDYLDGVDKEQSFFETDDKSGWYENEFMQTRLFTHTWFWVMGPTIPMNSVGKHIHWNDPIVQDINWQGALVYDLLGGPRDTVFTNYSPRSQSNHLLKATGENYLTVARKLISEANEMKKNVNSVIQTLDKDRRPHYEWIQLTHDKVIDYHLLMGVDCINDGNGWYPVLEE